MKIIPIKNVSVASAQYAEYCESACAVRPAIKFKLEVPFEAQKKMVRMDFILPHQYINPIELKKGSVVLIPLGSRAVTVLCSLASPDEKISEDEPVLCTTTSSDVVKLVKRFINACDDRKGEHFELGKQLMVPAAKA